MSAFLPQQSLRGRLILQLGIIAAILSVVFFFAVRSVSQQAAQAMQDNVLAASATSIAEAVRVERGELHLDLPYSALSMLGAISEDRVFYRVAHDGRTLTGYEDLVLDPVRDPGIADPRQASFGSSRFRDADVRLAVVARKISIDGHASEIVVAVAQTQEGLARVSEQISLLALMIGGGFFVLAVGLSAFAVGRTLRPLSRLASAVSRRGPGDLRPVQDHAPAEITPLVQSLNRFIDRLRRSLVRSEDFIAEAAHRVRTPLATVRAQAEIALRRVERPENKAALRQMIRAVDESSRSAGQLLDHAMVTFRADHMQLETIDLGLVVQELVDRVTPLAELKDITLQLDSVPTGMTLRCDPILIQNALRNIIDNAIKYSPQDSAVTVALGRDGDLLCVSVTDQGPGFGMADASHLTERFSRGTNVGGVVGSGLGLTIGKEVAEVHGGFLKLEDTKAGGACVSLYLSA